MKVRWTLPALNDLEDLLAYVDQHSPSGGGRVRDEINRTIDLIVDFPGTGRSTNLRSMRRLQVSRTNYVLFYDWVDDEITIYGVRHGARDPATMPGGDTPDETDGH
ncbi:MAG: type II toxin-antitoxin system RelE/ParE family toxin [Pseudomonadota bacterium]